MRSRAAKPGWYEDPERPGIDVYWDGQDFVDDVPPRPSPAPMWRETLPVALGVFAALLLMQLLFGW